MARHPLFLVDAFTREPFRGNPAAVCLLRSELPDSTLQAIAAEMNLSETAFVRAPDGDLFASDRFDLRWFTPTVEVPLCGHATLASARVLFDELGLSANPVLFDTRSGPLSATRRDDGIELDFPELVPVAQPAPAGLPDLLGPGPVEDAAAVPDRGVVLLRYPTPDALAALRPDFPSLVRHHPSVRVIVATARGHPPYDFVSRVFAPVDGIDEDPVTGTAHAALTPYWAAELGRETLRAFQASHRGGELTVRRTPGNRVGILGEARIVVRGYLDLPDHGPPVVNRG